MTETEQEPIKLTPEEEREIIYRLQNTFLYVYSIMEKMIDAGIMKGEKTLTERGKIELQNALKSGFIPETAEIIEVINYLKSVGEIVEIVYQPSFEEITKVVDGVLEGVEPEKLKKKKVNKNLH